MTREAPTATEPIAPNEIERLLKLRLVVARVGEMDLARWWNTKGQLGRLGAIALRRGFPRTHHFAQGRSVMAVAAARCRQLFDPPGSVTLWSLPSSIEDEFESQWERYLDQASDWQPFFHALESLTADVPSSLKVLELVDDTAMRAAGRLRRPPDGHALQLASTFTGSPADLSLLALGFGLGERARLVVPYMRLGDA